MSWAAGQMDPPVFKRGWLENTLQMEVLMGKSVKNHL
jgi:hypothetical protein